MAKYAVQIAITGKLTIEVEAEDEDEAYDNASDAMFQVLDGGNVEHDFEFRELDEVRVVPHEPKDDLAESPSP